MRRKSTFVTLTLAFLALAVFTNGQPKAPDEFVSVIGKFGVMLPSTIRDDFPYDVIRMGDEQLVAWIYRWDLDSDQAVIIHAVGTIDMETKADLYLERFRENYAPGSIR